MLFGIEQDATNYTNEPSRRKFTALTLSMMTMCLILITSCSATNVTTQTAELGQPSIWEEMSSSISRPGSLDFQKHVAADWAVNLSGLLNLDHPKALEAGIEDRLEPIQIFTYHITHPTHGKYIVDSGISESFRDPSSNKDLSFIVKQAMGTDLLEAHKTT